MITPELLRNCPIHPRPWGQVWWAKFLTLNYAFPPKTEVHIEGFDNIPTDRPVCLALNHTDRYNCWPLQWRMLRERNAFSVAWVKAKYYQHPFTRYFLLSTSNIPLASRGYVIIKEFSKIVGRKPTDEEYRFLRDLLDEKIEVNEQSLLSTSSECRQFLSPSPVQSLHKINTLFNDLSNEVVTLNEKALALGHNILVFPQGTRSKRLIRGHIGMAQMTQRLGIDIVPVGCMGSDVCYSGNAPWAKGGTITYRVGTPLTINGPELAPYRVTESFVPFSHHAQMQYGQQFRSITDIVMNRINDLLDEPYKMDSNQEQSSSGSTRFT